MMKISALAYAKINLLLDVTGVKENGYHRLFTVMQSFGLCDTLTAEQTGGDTVEIVCGSPDVPCNEKNIVYKCAVRFFEDAGIKTGRGIRFTIEKRIPVFAGLGGGSADGAAALVLLDKLYGTKLSQRALCEIGGKVGADIPFCIVGGTALALDTGSIVAPLPDIDDCGILIIKPSDGVSTKEAYAAVDACEIRHPASEKMLDLLLEHKSAEAFKYCDNVFEQAVEIAGRAGLKHTMRENGALAACMSGSGSAIYGIFNNTAEAERCADILRKSYDGVFVASPVNCGVKIFETAE